METDIGKKRGEDLRDGREEREKDTESRSAWLKTLFYLCIMNKKKKDE